MGPRPSHCAGPDDAEGQCANATPGTTADVFTYGPDTGTIGTWPTPRAMGFPERAQPLPIGPPSALTLFML